MMANEHLVTSHAPNDLQPGLKLARYETEGWRFAVVLLATSLRYFFAPDVSPVRNSVEFRFNL